ncbi:MAG: TetR family transcriptional regulator [Dehalobacter sp.]|nr:TetR family transcriptional regulator [Dehalobacter sp.]
MCIGTKKALTDAFLELCETMSITKITVQDIVDHCGASRQTFYNHFHDKFELIEWVYLRNFDDPLMEFQDYDRWARKSSRLISKNRHFYLQAYKTTDFMEWLEKWIYENMRNFISVKFGPQELTANVLYTLESYVRGAFRIFQKQLLSSAYAPIEESTVRDLKNMPAILRKYFPSSGNPT